MCFFVKSLKNLTEFKCLSEWYPEKINFPLSELIFHAGQAEN